MILPITIVETEFYIIFCFASGITAPHVVQIMQQLTDSPNKRLSNTATIFLQVSYICYLGRGKSPNLKGFSVMSKPNNFLLNSLLN